MHAIVARSFSRKTLAALAAKGVTVNRPVLVPDETGSCANARDCWEVLDNGTGRVLTVSQVFAMVSAQAEVF